MLRTRSGPICHLSSRRPRACSLRCGPNQRVAHADEEDADRGAEGYSPAGHMLEGNILLRGARAEPEADDPDRLPREEVEGAGFLERNLQMGDVDDPVVHDVAQAELREEPDEGAGGEDDPPSETHGYGEKQRREEEEHDVHGEDVEQRRAVDEEDGAGDGGARVIQVEIQQVGDGGAVMVYGPAGGDGEGERQEKHVVGVNLEGALPEARPDVGGVFHELADIEPADEQGRHEDEALSRGDVAEGLVDEVAEAGRKMRQRHPDEEQATQGIEFGKPLKLGEMHD
jgi:hypothetical protein